MQDKILSGKAAEDRHNSNLAKKLASTENTIQEVVGLAGQVLPLASQSQSNEWKNAKESHGKYLGGL